jgi:hypothetical protein
MCIRDRYIDFLLENLTDLVKYNYILEIAIFFAIYRYIPMTIRAIKSSAYAPR